MTSLNEGTPTDYKLWLVRDSLGHISLTGWSETIDTTAPDASGRLDRWPTYPLCADRANLLQRLAELDLNLAAGFTIDDLDKQWDVYVRHPDIAALRERLNTEQVNLAAQ